MKSSIRRFTVIILISMVVFFLMSNASAEEMLVYPVITETDCNWDDAGHLISETAHTLDGAPALNARGFYKAEYTWDEYGNLSSEAYYGLNGNPVTIDKGYALSALSLTILRVPVDGLNCKPSLLFDPAVAAAEDAALDNNTL